MPPTLPSNLNVELPVGLGAIPPPIGAITPNINFSKLLETNLIADSAKTQNTHRNFNQKIKSIEPAMLKASVVENGTIDSILKYAMVSLVLGGCYFAFTKGAASAIRNYLQKLNWL